MFSAKKFRLWPRQSASSKKDLERNSAKEVRRSSQTKTDNEYLTSNIFPSNQENTQTQAVQKLTDENKRLEGIIKDLTPYKIQVAALEKKLIVTAQSFEKKDVRYTAAVSSLEYENEQLREEIKRLRTVCDGCYYCSRPNQLQNNQKPFSSKSNAVGSAAEAMLHSRSDRGSDDSMHSSESSSRRLERLEEEQSAIIEETSRQKHETSRRLQQISNELIKALVSQKSLRKDCTQLQERISQLERQNERLNKVLFRHYTPSSSSSSSSLHTRHATIKRNEYSICHSEVAQKVIQDKQLSSPNNSSSEVQNDAEISTPKVIRNPYVPPYRNRFSRENYTTEIYASKDYDRDSVRERAASMGRTVTNQDHASYGVPKITRNRNSLSESEIKSSRQSWKERNLENEDKDKYNHNWESTSSIITLQDETEELLGITTSDKQQNTLKHGSNFSLNDILDGDIDELRFSLQNLESARHNKNSTRNSQSKVEEYFEDSEKMAGNTVNNGLSKHSSSAEKSQRYSYPVSLSSKRGVESENRIKSSECIDRNEADKAQRGFKPECQSPCRQKQLESAVEKIENGIAKKTGKTEESLCTKRRKHHKDHPDEYKEATMSIDDLVWKIVQKGQRLDNLSQESAQSPTDSLKVVTENSSVRENDCDSKRNMNTSEMNPLKANTSKNESVAENFQGECLYMHQSMGQEKHVTEVNDSQTVTESELVDRNDSTPETEEFRKDSSDVKKSADKTSTKRDSLTNKNISEDEGKEITMSKEKLTTLTVYLKEVQAEQHPDDQHNNLKPRTRPFGSKSSTESKKSPSFDYDAGKNCNIILSQPDEFQPIRYQPSNDKEKEKADKSIRPNHKSDPEKPFVQDLLKPEVHQAKVTQYNETNSKTSETETNIGSHIQISQSIELDSAQDVTPVEIAMPQDKSERTNDEITSSQSPLETSLHETKLLSGAMKSAEQDVGISSACTPEDKNKQVTASSYPEEQIHCKSLPSCSSSVADDVTPHVDYVRSSSLRTFWDAVTPPPSLNSQKQDEEKCFLDATSQDVQTQDQIHLNEDDQTKRRNETQISNKTGNLSDAFRDELLKKVIIPTQTEGKDDIQQHILPVPFPKQMVVNFSINKTKDFRNDCNYDSDLQTDDHHRLLNVSKQNEFKEKSENYPRDNSDLCCNKTGQYSLECEDKKREFLSKYKFPDNQQSLETPKHLSIENPAEGVSSKPTVNEFEHLLGRIPSKSPTPRSTRFRNEETHTETLTEEDIVKYQLGHREYRKNAACEDRLSPSMYSRMELRTETDGCESQSQRGLSSKPPLPPKRFNVTRYYVQDGSISDHDQEILDYEELQGNGAYRYLSPEKGFHGDEFSNYDNHGKSVLDLERYVFRIPKSDVHIPTGCRFAFQKQPVQFRNYSKSWDSGKRNSCPAARFRRYSQPDEEWDNVPSTDTTWSAAVDIDKNVRPLSAHQFLDTSIRGFNAKSISRVDCVNRKQLSRGDNPRNSKDTGNDRVFYEITKQIETMKQTVSELKNKKTERNSRF